LGIWEVVATVSAFLTVLPFDQSDHGSIIFVPVADSAIQIDSAQLPSGYRACEKPTVRNALSVATS